MAIVLEYWWVGIITVPLLAIALKKLFDRTLSETVRKEEGALFRNIALFTCPACGQSIHTRELREDWCCPRCSVSVKRDRKSTALLMTGTLGLALSGSVLSTWKDMHPALHAALLAFAFASIGATFWAIGCARLVVKAEDSPPPTRGS